MARACFNPRAAPECVISPQYAQRVLNTRHNLNSMFVRLGRIEEKIAGRAGFDFLQTHPSSSKRVQASHILPSTNPF